MFDFGVALNHLRAGFQVRRSGWGHSLRLDSDRIVRVRPDDGHGERLHTWVPVMDPDGDLLATDWTYGDPATQGSDGGVVLQNSAEGEGARAPGA